jgi:hypothetical protein
MPIEVSKLGAHMRAQAPAKSAANSVCHSAPHSQIQFSRLACHHITRRLLGAVFTE